MTKPPLLVHATGECHPALILTWCAVSRTYHPVRKATRQFGIPKASDPAWPGALIDSWPAPF